jgi:hypothetical protein
MFDPVLASNRCPVDRVAIMTEAAKSRPDLPPVSYDWSLAFEHETTRKGLAFWHELRGTNALPSFKDFSPRGIKDFISNVSLIESRAQEDGKVDYSVRLTGERVRERYGAVAHRKLQEFLPLEMERRWREALDLVRSAQAPLRVHGRMSYRDNTWLYQETLLAPLTDGTGTVSMFLLVTDWRPSDPDRDTGR